MRSADCLRRWTKTKRSSIRTRRGLRLSALERTRRLKNCRPRSNGYGARDSRMLKDLLEFGKGLLDLVQKMRRQDEDIKKLDERVTRLTERVDSLTAVVQAIAYQLERDRED